MSFPFSWQSSQQPLPVFRKEHCPLSFQWSNIIYNGSIILTLLLIYSCKHFIDDVTDLPVVVLLRIREGRYPLTSRGSTTSFDGRTGPSSSCSSPLFSETPPFLQSASIYPCVSFLLSVSCVLLCLFSLHSLTAASSPILPLPSSSRFSLFILPLLRSGALLFQGRRDALGRISFSVGPRRGFGSTVSKRRPESLGKRKTPTVYKTSLRLGTGDSRTGDRRGRKVVTHPNLPPSVPLRSP